MTLRTGQLFDGFGPFVFGFIYRLGEYQIFMARSATSKPYTEVQLNTWNKVRAKLARFPGTWMFRGQSKAEWPMATSLDRLNADMSPGFLEGMIIREFQRRAHHYLPTHLLPGNSLEWLALMQHHGAPTRLLDWTFSRYVACFFALEAVDGSAAVWAIDYLWCRHTALQIILKKIQKPGFEAKGLGAFEADVVREHKLREHFDHVFFELRPRCAMPVVPEHFNERLGIQQGLFLCPGDPNGSFMSNLLAHERKDISHHVVKLVLNGQMQREALHDLNYMNINRSTLFPGLDGFAQSLKTKMLTYRLTMASAEATEYGYPF